MNTNIHVGIMIMNMNMNTIINTADTSPDLASRACQTLGIFFFRSSKFVCQHLSLLRCLGGPRRHQILLPPQLRRSWAVAGSMTLSPFWAFLFLLLDLFLSFLLSFLSRLACLTLLLAVSFRFETISSDLTLQI